MTGVTVPKRYGYRHLEKHSRGAAPDASRLRKKAFRSLLALSVISPRGGELEFLHFQALAAWIKCAVLYWTASC